MKKKNWLCYFMVLFFVILSPNTFAEEINLDNNTTLIFSSPKNWPERKVPQSMMATKKIWQTEDGLASVEIKSIATKDLKISTTEEFGKLLFNSYSKIGKEMNIKVIGSVETVTLNENEWEKITTSGLTEEGAPARTETYYIVKNNVALQIRITGPAQDWQKTLNEIKTSLESVTFK